MGNRRIDRFDEYMKHTGLNDNKVTVDLGLSVGTLGKSRNENRDLSDRVIELILNFYTELNRVWLLTGEGEMLQQKDPIAAARLLRLKKGDMKVSQEPRQYTTYLLPMTAMGGSLTGFAADGVLPQQCERIISPVADVDFAITVYGDSMAPEYPSGCRVFVKKIDEESYIAWGNVYIIDTTNGVILKEVQQADDPESIRCVSLNPSGKYKPFDVPRKDVLAMYRIIICITAK